MYALVLAGTTLQSLGRGISLKYTVVADYLEFATRSAQVAQFLHDFPFLEYAFMHCARFFRALRRLHMRVRVLMNHSASCVPQPLGL